MWAECVPVGSVPPAATAAPAPAAVAYSGNASAAAPPAPRNASSIQPIPTGHSTTCQLPLRYKGSQARARGRQVGAAT